MNCNNRSKKYKRDNKHNAIVKSVMQNSWSLKDYKPKANANINKHNVDNSNKLSITKTIACFMKNSYLENWPKLTY